jgi:hypothetical protein
MDGCAIEGVGVSGGVGGTGVWVGVDEGNGVLVGTVVGVSVRVGGIGVSVGVGGDDNTPGITKRINGTYTASQIPNPKTPTIIRAKRLELARLILIGPSSTLPIMLMITIIGPKNNNTARTMAK